MPMPPLISTVGPVEPALLDAFITHYQQLGVERFLLALHFPFPTPQERQDELLAVCLDRIGKPEIVVEEPWHENSSDPLRDELRRRAGPGWHLLADVDEFQQYPDSLDAVIADAEASGAPAVGGVLLDRVAADGSMAPWSVAVGLDRSYPLGGFITAEMLGGNPNKLVLAHSRVHNISTGNHEIPDFRPPNNPLVIIHHFKWRAGVLEYLRERVRRLASGEWRELSSAPRDEASLLLSHVGQHDDRIVVDDPTLPFRPVGMREFPSWWDDESQQLKETWPPRIVRGR